ncbi:MAG: DUF3570 domain-containing protein [Sphingobacteriales bacterium]|nr:MAG: DUF3570 domain-containing protein [Sphingobacteriales bacterium]
MRKICLTVIGLYISFLSAFSQKNRPDTVYTPKPLKVDEVNLISSYYTQEGNHSAVTGGIGNEHVIDLSTGLEVKFVGWDTQHNKHTLSAELGFDHHTAASSAYVSKTGASKTGGTRIYPSLNWSVENLKGNSFGIGVYYSHEYNYQSVGLEVNGSKKLSSNTEINGKVSGFFDRVKMIYPSELIPGTNNNTTGGGYSTYTTASGRTVTVRDGQEYSDDIPSSARNTFTASASLAQIVNKRMQFSVMTDLVEQTGYLGLPFHRVYFTDGTAHVENLPDNRTKLPLGFRLNYFMGDHFVFRAYYRYYMDSWGIRSHTADIEIPVKFNSFFSVSPFYRYYTQTAAKYFGAYATHTSADTYYTSNFSYSKLNSQFYGVGIHLAPPKGILNQHLNTLEVRYGHYTQSTDLYSNVISFAFTFK